MINESGERELSVSLLGNINGTDVIFHRRIS